MNFSATLTITEEPDQLFAVLTKDKEHKRSQFTIIKKEGAVVIEVTAEDAVAFRATMNSITESLAVFHKMRKLP